jgi:hypothetical protein
MQLKYFVLTGQVPRIHPAALFLISAFLLISLLMRKSFCGWLCPVGTVSEYLWKLGRYTVGRTHTMSRGLDVPLRALKYLLLAFFVYAVASMSASAIANFLASPNALIVDVRMLNFFRYLGGTAAFAVLGLVVFDLCAEFLVPVPLSLRCTDGTGVAAEPTARQSHRIGVHRLHQMRKARPAMLPVNQLVQIRPPNAWDTWSAWSCVPQKMRWLSPRQCRDASYGAPFQRGA